MLTLINTILAEQSHWKLVTLYMSNDICIGTQLFGKAYSD